MLIQNYKKTYIMRLRGSGWSVQNRELKAKITSIIGKKLNEYRKIT